MSFDFLFWGTEQGEKNRRKSAVGIVLKSDFLCSLEDLYRKRQSSEQEMTRQCPDCNNNWNYSQQNPSILICYMNFRAKGKGQFVSTNFHHSAFWLHIPVPKVLLTLVSVLLWLVPCICSHLLPFAAPQIPPFCPQHLYSLNICRFMSHRSPLSPMLCIFSSLSTSLEVNLFSLTIIFFSIKMINLLINCKKAVMYMSKLTNRNSIMKTSCI